jgi:hypothetical protein
MDYPLMLVGKPSFDISHETSDQLASGGQDGQADHDENYTLKNRKEKAQDPKPDEDPANDQNSNLLELIHSSLCLDIIS